MLERLFGWSKASKCKALVKIVISRVKLLRNRRSIQIKQLRVDIAQLLGNGQCQSCFKRVDFLFKEQNLLDGYDMVEVFCNRILERLSYIRRHKDRPQDINEAVSSLIYASARLADLPELRHLRSLFAKRYGYEFTSAAVELHPDSCVNQQIIEQLSVKLPALDLKLKLMKDIAIEFNLLWDSLNIEAEHGEHAKDSLTGSGGSEKFKTCQNGVDSSFHPSFHDASAASYVDGTFIHSINDGSINVNEFSHTIKKQRGEYFDEHNEKTAVHTGCEDKMFERDIPMVSSSVKEKIVETSSIEKEESLPSGIGSQNWYNNVGRRSNGHEFVKGTSFDSCSIDNLQFEDLDYDRGSAAELADGVTSLAANHSKISKPPMEGKNFDCQLDYTSENEEDVSDKRKLHQSDTMPLQSKHSRWTSTAENAYSRSQTCLPERKEVLADRDSELRSTRYPTPKNSQKSKSVQISSNPNGERQRLDNYPKVHVNARRGSPRSHIDVKKVGDNRVEVDRERWRSPRPKNTKADIESFIVVDDTGVSERHAEGWNMRDTEFYFKNSIEVDVSSKQGDTLKHRYSSRTRKKVRPESRRRHSLSSHYPIEIKGLYHDYINSVDNTSFPMSNRPDHFETVSSRNENRARESNSEEFVKKEGGVTFRKYSDCGTNTRVMAQPFYEDEVRSVSRNGQRVSYDMMDSYIDSNSDDEVSTIPQNIYLASDCPPLVHVRPCSKKTVERRKNGNEQHSFEEGRHGTKKLATKDYNNVGKWRSNEGPNGFQLPGNDEMLNGSYSSRKQIFDLNEETRIASSVQGRSYGPQQNGDEGTLHFLDDSGEDMLFRNEKNYTSSFIDSYPYKLQQHRDEGTLHSPDSSQSSKSVDHLQNHDPDVEQHFQQSIDTRQWPNPALRRHCKNREMLYTGRKTLENKPQRGRNKSLDLSQKHLYDIDIDSSDLEHQFVRQSHSTGKVRKADHETNSESVRRGFDYRNRESNPCGGSSKLLEKSCEEPGSGDEIYDDSTTRRIGNFCTPRVSFVYFDRKGKAQRHHSPMCYTEETEYNQFCFGRQKFHETDHFPVKERQHDYGANLKDRNATCNLVRNEETESSLYEAHNIFKSRNPSSVPDQVESLNQPVCVEKTSMDKISTSTMLQDTNFVKKNACTATAATPCRPPLSPATPSSLVCSEFRSHGKPYGPASPSTRPPQRPPPKLPCKWERVVSLPPEHSKASLVRLSMRSQSMQIDLPKETTSCADSPRVPHVHPKLPEYDDFAAKFIALKEQHRTSTASE